MTGQAVSAERKPAKGIEALWAGRKWTEGIRAVLDDQYTGEMMFLAGFGIYQIICMWATTMFPFPYKINLLGRLAAMGIVTLKVVLYAGYRPWQLIGILLAGGCSAITLLTTGYIHPFVWILFLAGSRDVPLKKILEVYLVITGAGMILAYGASMLGIIENLQYVMDERGIRNSFGIVYTTDFSAHIFYIMVIGFYLLGERLRGWHYLGGVAVAALIWHYCNARLDTVCILLTVGLFWIGNMIMFPPVRCAEFRCFKKPGCENRILHAIQKFWSLFWRMLGPWSVPVCAVGALALTWAYGKVGGTILVKLDWLSSRRLSFGWVGIEEYGFHLFGKAIESVGAGQTTHRAAGYFFVDCSYVNMFLRFGILFGITVLVCYWISCRKYRCDLHFQYMVALIALNCIIAHHLMEAAYNPLLLATMAGDVFCQGNKGIKLRKR